MTMSTHCCLTKSLVPCNAPTFLLELVDASLSEGTATLRVLSNGEPLQCEVIGFSYVLLPPPPSTSIVTSKCCQKRTTDRNGEFTVEFPAGAQNEVRLDVNVTVRRSRKQSANVRLFVCVVPDVAMGSTALSFESTGFTGIARCH